MKRGSESQGTLTRIWAEPAKGSVARRAMEGRRRANAARVRASAATGGLPGPTCSAPSELVEDCPARGTGAALVMPTVSIEAMNKHLAEISQCVSVRAIALLS
jgi:hypothetical protein